MTCAGGMFIPSGQRGESFSLSLSLYPFFLFSHPTPSSFWFVVGIFGAFALRALRQRGKFKRGKLSLSLGGVGDSDGGIGGKARSHSFLPTLCPGKLCSLLLMLVCSANSTLDTTAQVKNADPGRLRTARNRPRRDRISFFLPSSLFFTIQPCHGAQVIGAIPTNMMVRCLRWAKSRHLQRKAETLYQTGLLFGIEDFQPALSAPLHPSPTVPHDKGRAGRQANPNPSSRPKKSPASVDGRGKKDKGCVP
ncbi:hypothetical protein LY76DRAFT_363505 [Colletotrichum caudatum]|nr:hypothetical protein LY76DRAFT_363505 [Colletotrichum caudatum]